MKPTPSKKQKPVANKLTAKKPVVKKPRPPKQKPDKGWVLRLYVAGQTPKSLAAFANLKRLCEEHLIDCYSLEVIDLLQQPQLAEGDQIVALPTLVRRLPEPMKRIVGDLSNTERVVVGMDLRKGAK